MSKSKIFQITLLCLVIIMLLINSVGCADDNQQIRNVINKFYHQEWTSGYFEGLNSDLVMPDYDYVVGKNENALLTYLKAKEAKEVKLRFSEIDVGEDYAVVEYRLIVMDTEGEQWSASFITQMIRDDGKWKLAFTKPGY